MQLSAGALAATRSATRAGHGGGAAAGAQAPTARRATAACALTSVLERVDLAGTSSRASTSGREHLTLRGGVPRAQPGGPAGWTPDFVLVSHTDHETDDPNGLFRRATLEPGESRTAVDPGGFGRQDAHARRISESQHASSSLSGYTPGNWRYVRVGAWPKEFDQRGIAKAGGFAAKVRLQERLEFSTGPDMLRVVRIRGQPLGLGCVCVWVVVAVQAWRASPDRLLTTHWNAGPCLRRQGDAGRHAR